MQRRTVVIAVSILGMALLGPPAAQAGPGDPPTLAPVQTDQDLPWTSGGAANGASDPVPVSPPSVQLQPLMAVPPATYAQEKQAAVNGPAPSGPQVAPQPPPSGGPVQAAMPTLFDGLDRPQAQNNGFVFTPPDTIVGKSPNRILEGVNSAVRLFNNSGGIIQTLNLNTFFGAPTTNGLLFDPKIYFDRNAANRRFYVVAVQVAGRGDTSTANDVSRIWVAVSRSPDPANLAAGTWCRYNIEGRRDVGTANVSWADYPQIGAGRDSFSFAMNQFRFANDSFTFADVRVWDKNVASNNATSCPTVPRFTFRTR
jgi:hypothetical protein